MKNRQTFLDIIEKEWLPYSGFPSTLLSAMPTRTHSIAGGPSPDGDNSMDSEGEEPHFKCYCVGLRGLVVRFWFTTSQSSLPVITS